MSRILEFFRTNRVELLIVFVTIAVCVAASLIAKVQFAWSWWCYPFTAVYAVTLGVLVFLCVLDRDAVLKNMKAMQHSLPKRMMLVVCCVAAGCYWCMVALFGLMAVEAATLLIAGLAWFFAFGQVLCLVVRVQ